MAANIEPEKLTEAKNKPEIPRLKVSVTDECDGDVVSRKVNVKRAEAIALVAGAQNIDVGITSIRQLMACLPVSMQTDEEALNAAFALVCDIDPQDAVESALATQMAATHHASLEMMSRVMIEEQTAEGVNYGINRVTKLMRTYTAQMEALQKYRSKGQQTIQVQHVQVNEGGQAIVGNVKAGGRGNG